MSGSLSARSGHLHDDESYGQTEVTDGNLSVQTYRSKAPVLTIFCENFGYGVLDITGNGTPERRL
jgi:hypothetical protein